jgi:hypothetical protein
MALAGCGARKGNTMHITPPQPVPTTPEPMPQQPPEFPGQVPPEIEEPEVPGEHEPMHDPQAPPPITAWH